MKRRARRLDEFANRRRIRAVLTQFAAQVFPAGIAHKRLTSFLYAMQHVERRTATNTRRGRTGRFDRTLLISSTNRLRQILATRTNGRVTFERFVAKYLPLLEFLDDVIEPLEAGEINLEEAHLLARVTKERLGITGQAAFHQRRKLLQTHLARGDSQNVLRARVLAVLGETPSKTVVELSREVKRRVAESDELLEFDASDADHLLWEEIKNTVFMMKEIEAEDLDDELLEELLERNGELQNSLQKALKRKTARLVKADKIARIR